MPSAPSSPPCHCAGGPKMVYDSWRQIDGYLRTHVLGARCASGVCARRSQGNGDESAEHIHQSHQAGRHPLGALAGSYRGFLLPAGYAAVAVLVCAGLPVRVQAAHSVVAAVRLQLAGPHRLGASAAPSAPGVRGLPVLAAWATQVIKLCLHSVPDGLEPGRIVSGGKQL